MNRRGIIKSVGAGLVACFSGAMFRKSKRRTAKACVIDVDSSGKSSAVLTLDDGEIIEVERFTLNYTGPSFGFEVPNAEFRPLTPEDIPEPQMARVEVGQASGITLDTWLKEYQ